MKDDNFADLIARAKLGEDAAVRELLKTFEPEIRMMVRVKLPTKLRGKFDSMDFVQAVWASFFVRLRDTEIPFENSRHLGKFLSGIALNKVNEEHRKRTMTEKYNIVKETKLYYKCGNREVPVEVMSHDPSPSEEAQAGDRLRQLLRGQAPEMETIVRLRQAGFSYEEIAVQVQLHERTVRRMVSGMKSRVET